MKKCPCFFKASPNKYIFIKTPLSLKFDFLAA